jgi:hypothetical protein
MTNGLAAAPDEHAPGTRSEPPPAGPRPRRWRRRLRRIAITIATILCAAYLVVWWFALRIVEHPSWPPRPMP